MRKYFKCLPFILFGFAIVLNSCSESEEDETLLLTTKSQSKYSMYFYDGLDLANMTAHMWDSLASNPNMTAKELEQELANFLSSTIPSNPVYDFISNESFEVATEGSLERIANDINEIEYMSTQTKEYASNLINALIQNDGSLLLQLRHDFKDDIINNTGDLYMLDPIFDIISHYEGQFQSGFVLKSNCEIDGGVVLTAALIGGFSTAITGGTGGSLFGPVGTIGGFVGGFLYGAGMATISAIGAQGIACEARR